jgi:hypothetical protein
VFVFAVIFSAFAIPGRYQHRVLMLGIVGALLMRAAFVVAGVTLLDAFHPVIYLFGDVLLAHRPSARPNEACSQAAGTSQRRYSRPTSGGPPWSGRSCISSRRWPACSWNVAPIRPAVARGADEAGRGGEGDPVASSVAVVLA